MNRHTFDSVETQKIDTPFPSVERLKIDPPNHTVTRMYKTPHKGKGKGHRGQHYTYGISKKEG